MTESTSEKPTILVVDDSRLMRVAARKILKNEFDILEAEDGEVAWELLQANDQISLVMSDLSMPNLDGLGLLKEIRGSAESRLRELPVIIVTGAEDDDGSKKTALSAGASDFITKPFESVQLLARTQAQAKHQRTQQALEQSEATKREMETQGGVDALTGLPDHSAFDEHLEGNLAYAARHRTEFAMLLIQVDKYKILFLRRGRQTAEEVLRRLAQLFSEGRRREDKVARIDMDTFGILLPSANPVGARRVAEQLLNAVEQQDFEINGETIPFTLSIAVSTPPAHGDTRAADLMSDAREKLKAAQKAGGNRVQHSLAEGDAETTSPESDETGTQVQPETIPAARIAEVQQALQALSNASSAGSSADEVARAVLPLLEAWNETHHNRHGAILEQLRSALGLEHGDEPVTTASPSPSFDSIELAPS